MPDLECRPKTTRWRHGSVAVAILLLLGACETVPQGGQPDRPAPAAERQAHDQARDDRISDTEPAIVNVPDAEGRPILHRTIVPGAKPDPFTPSPVTAEPAPVPRDLAALKRLAGPVIEATFGPPALTRQEPNATLWRYGNDTCALMIYFGSNGGHPAHASIRWIGDQGREGDCLATLAAR